MKKYHYQRKSWSVTFSTTDGKVLTRYYRGTHASVALYNARKRLDHLLTLSFHQTQ